MATWSFVNKYFPCMTSICSILNCICYKICQHPECLISLFLTYEKFEDIKGPIRSHIYEDRHYHAQKKNKPRIDKSPQTTNNWARRNALKKDGELECFVSFGNKIKHSAIITTLPKRSRDATFISFEHSLI